jgi:hypothetical protein
VPDDPAAGGHGPPDELAAAVGGRYGLRVRALAGGVTNSCYALGDGLILRVPRTAGFRADLAREALVIPPALAAGVPTAAIVESATGFMVQTRVAGTDAATSRGPLGAGFHRGLGAALARLHTVTDVDGLPADPPEDPDAPLHLVASYRGKGLVDPESAGWLTGWLGALRRPPLPPALLHGDVAPQNLMVAPDGTFAGLVDWGDARVADPAADFAKLPPPVLGEVLTGYLGTADPAGWGDWPARVLRHHLHWALGRLADPAPAPGRHWTAPPYARLLTLMRFFTNSPPEPWSSLLP